MRRRDREITDENAIAEFIAKEQILRIAFYDKGDIYIVPVNYGYSVGEQYTFYFHGAKAGRKYELAKKYITYRYTRELVRKSNTTDLAIKELIDGINGFQWSLRRQVGLVYKLDIVGRVIRYDYPFFYKNFSVQSCHSFLSCAPISIKDHIQ